MGSVEFTSHSEIVILEDDERRQQAMSAALARRCSSLQVTFFDNAPDLISYLQTHLQGIRIISLDHDLGPDRERHGRRFDPGTGRDVAEYLANRPPECPVIIATTNTMARPGMEMVLRDAGWHCQIVVPWGDVEWIDSAWEDAIARACHLPG